MSRIGNKPINLNDGVTVEINERNLVTVKGPKGTLTQQVNPDLKVKIEDGVLSVSRPTEQKRHKAMHDSSTGRYRNPCSSCKTK